MPRKARRCLVLCVLCLGKCKTLDIPELIGYVPDPQPYHLIITSAPGSWPYKLTSLQVRSIETIKPHVIYNMHYTLVQEALIMLLVTFSGYKLVRWHISKSIARKIALAAYSHTKITVA